MKTDIEIRHLTYRYPDGTPALDDIRFVVQEGEHVGIAGANGAGKTTLLLHLNGVLNHNKDVKIGGLPITRENLKAIRRQVGLVFQDPDDQLFCPTVYEDVAFGLRNLGLAPEEVDRRVHDALENVGMAGFEERSAFHLSFGQKKLVSIATVLPLGCRILALDEPTSNLDPRARREMIELLQRFKQTLLIVTHDLDAIQQLCERTVILNRGRIVADGPSAQILTDRTLLKKYDLY